MHSKGAVRRIIEEEGELLVSFPNHDGYFTLPPGDDALKAKAVESQEKGKEVVFTFDRDLRILSIT